MDPRRFAHVKRLLLEAMALPPAERDAFLDREAEDDELRDEVASLLAQDDARRSVLEPGRLVQEVGPELRPADEPPPEEIGPYRLGELLGSGGMGVVYQARQLRPLERDVALKLVKRGMDTAGVVARFEAERQTLASLDHPNIAAVLGAGADDRGRPYFVMELVRGEAITRFADRVRLSVTDRIELVQQACRAVHHAHQRGIVHRDLKPSNVLVQETDDGPLVKIIDFGIAKAVEEPAGLTLAGQVLGTPQYMSPEQAGYGAGHVDTRTDVYAIGVLLYELLTGHLPVPVPADAPLEALRVLATAEPSRPSVAVRTVAERPGDPPTTIAPDEVARARRTTVDRLSRQLAGDLENILALAMRKDPEERYASMHQLAEDLDRYCAGLPVRACRPTFAYRASRFVGRNRLPVALAVVLAMLVVGFVGALIVQSRHLAAERDRAVAAEVQATAKAETARRTTEFLVELFEGSDPSETRGSEVTARELLERGAERVRDELAEEPEVRAALLDAVGRVYQSLGLWEEAEPLLQEALRDRRAHLGDDHLDTAQSIANVAFLLQDLDRIEEAEPLLREALAVREARLEPTAEPVTSARFALAALLRRKGDIDGAEAAYRAVLETERAALGPQHPYVAMDLNNLASVLLVKDELDEAERLFRESLAINLATGGADHPETATNHANLALVQVRRGDLEGALQSTTRALQIRRKVYGEEHPHVAMSINIQAAHLQALGRLEEAEARFREALAMRRRLQGERHPDVANNLVGLGGLLSRAGRHDEAMAALQEALSIGRERLAPDHIDMARTVYGLGMAHLRRGEPRAAEPYLREALAIRRAALPSGHRETLASLAGLGWCALALERWDEAETLLLGAHRGGVEHLGEDHRLVVEARERLVELYEALGDPARAARYQPADP